MSVLKNNVKWNSWTPILLNLLNSSALFKPIRISPFLELVSFIAHRDCCSNFDVSSIGDGRHLRQEHTGDIYFVMVQYALPFFTSATHSTADATALIGTACPNANCNDADCGTLLPSEVLLVHCLPTTTTTDDEQRCETPANNEREWEVQIAERGTHTRTMCLCLCVRAWNKSAHIWKWNQVTIAAAVGHWEQESAPARVTRDGW